MLYRKLSQFNPNSIINTLSTHLPAVESKMKDQEVKDWKVKKREELMMKFLSKIQSQYLDHDEEFKFEFELAIQENILNIQRDLKPLIEMLPTWSGFNYALNYLFDFKNLKNDKEFQGWYQDPHGNVRTQTKDEWIKIEKDKWINEYKIAKVNFWKIQMEKEGN